MKRWVFLYWPSNISPAKQDKQMRVRCYAGSLKRACDRMYAWLQRRDRLFEIDYEVQDLQHSGQGHDCVDLTTINHPIHEYTST